jgi:threonine/homoserine/homoserine lactone efflux protein
MLAQAAGFAVLAAISPTALLVMAVFLSSADPRRTAIFYVVGAMLMTVAMAITVLFILRAAGLDQPREHEPLYAFRLSLGILGVAAAAVIARRRPRAKPEQQAGQPGKGFLSRLIARPGAGAAFAVGVILFVPSTTFIAAVQVVASAQADATATVVALVIVVLISALIVWLPLIGFLAAPDVTTRTLRRANDWLRAHGRMIGVYALAAGGVILIVNGCLGLAG